MLCQLQYHYTLKNHAPLVNDIFANPLNAESFTIILGAIAFGMQIYGYYLQKTFFSKNQ
jgi:hypothetical protein